MSLRRGWHGFLAQIDPGKTQGGYWGCMGILAKHLSPEDCPGGPDSYASQHASAQSVWVPDCSIRDWASLGSAGRPNSLTLTWMHYPEGPYATGVISQTAVAGDETGPSRDLLWDSTPSTLTQTGMHLSACLCTNKIVPGWLQQEGLELRPEPLGICYGTEARELHLNSEEWVLPSKLLCRCSISLTAAEGARAETWPPQILMWDRGWKAHTHWLRMCMCLRKTLNRWNSSLIAAGGVRAETVFWQELLLDQGWRAHLSGPETCLSPSRSQHRQDSFQTPTGETRTKTGLPQDLLWCRSWRAQSQ